MGGVNGFTLASSKLIASLARHQFRPVHLFRTNDRHVFDRPVLAVLAISLLAAVAYAYTCFIALLLWPGSPGRLSGFAMAFLLVWVALGTVVYRSTRTRTRPLVDSAASSRVR